MNHSDRLGYTPLHRGCDWNSKEACEELMKFGAALTTENKDGVSPSEYCITDKFRDGLEKYADSDPTPSLKEISEYSKYAEKEDEKKSYPPEDINKHSKGGKREDLDNILLSVLSTQSCQSANQNIQECFNFFISEDPEYIGISPEKPPPLEY